MRTRLIRALLGALALCLAQAAANGATPRPPSRLPIQIQLWHAMDGTSGEALERSVARFNASQKDYRVAAAYKGDYRKTMDAGLAAARAGKAPHVLQVYDAGAAGMVAAPKIYKPLHQLAADSRIKIERESFPSSLAAFYSDATGRLLALPFNSSTPLLYYNRDAFRRAGLDPDRPPKTWYELQTMLLALREAGEACPYTTSSPSWIQVENMSAWHDYPFASRNSGIAGEYAKLEINNLLLMRHISLLSAWAKSRLFIYSGRTNEGEARFASGACAVLTGSSAAYGGLSRALTFRLGVAQLPYYDDLNGAPFNTLADGAALWAMAGKSAREYAGVARFLEFLASPAVMADWCRSTGSLPVTRDAYLTLQSSGYYREHPELVIAVKELFGFKAGSYANGVRLGNFTHIRDIIDDELEVVWQGSITPKAALDMAVVRANAQLRKFDKSPRP